MTTNLEGILGVIVSTQTPWIAQCPVYKHLDAEKMLAHKLRALHLNKNKLKCFRGICTLSTGQEIYIPKIKNIQIQTTDFGHCHQVTWGIESIDIKQDMILLSTHLIDDLGVLVLINILPAPISCTLGATLHLSKFTLLLG